MDSLSALNSTNLKTMEPLLPGKRELLGVTFTDGRKSLKRSGTNMTEQLAIQYFRTLSCWQQVMFIWKLKKLYWVAHWPTLVPLTLVIIAGVFVVAILSQRR